MNEFKFETTEPGSGRLTFDFAFDLYNELCAKHETLKPRQKKENFFKKYGGDDVTIGLIKDKKMLSMLDKDTGLFSKEAYDVLAPGIVEKGDYRAIGVLMIDLDYLGWVNEIFKAHSLGDLYIKSAGNLIRNNLRSESDLGFHISGDEFIVLIKDSFDQKSAESVTKRYHDILNGNIIGETLRIIMEGKRKVRIETGGDEPESVFALKQFFRGLKNIKDNVGDVRTTFLETAKGTKEKKSEFLELLDKINLEEFGIFLEGEQIDYDSEEFTQIKRNAVNKINEVLSFMTVTTGGFFVRKEANLSYKVIKDRADEVLMKAKEHGRGKYITMYL